MTSLFVYDANVKKELKIDVKSASVADLYFAVAKLYDNLENPRKHLSLLFTDKELTFSKKKTIISLGIINGSTIGAVLCLPDGCHGAVSDGVAVATGTTMETGIRELQIEETTEKDEVTLERENSDKNAIFRMRENDEGREEFKEREEEKKKKRKKKKRKTKIQSEPENDGMRKDSKEFNEEDERMNRTEIGHLIEETEERENDKDPQEKITKRKKKKKRSGWKTKEHHENEEVKRPPLRSLPGIEITDEEDFNYNSPSARLPCTHLISSESMREHCEFELAKGKTEIKCATCPKKLEHRVVRGIACFTPGEMHSFEKAVLDLTLGKDGDVFPCSNCKAWTKALDKEANSLRCFCYSERTGQRFLFCRNCFKEWKNPSDRRCTNLSCESDIESTLEVLRKSPTIFPFFFLEIYQHRVCPRCGLLTEFAGGCTQVHCEHCGYFYCFVCLSGAKSKEELNCLPYFSYCSLAPIQTKIPIWRSE